MVLIVAGKFDEAKALALRREILRLDPETAAQARRHLHRGTAAGRRAHRDPAPRRHGAAKSAWRITFPSASHADWAPLSLLGGIISQSPNGRLYKALVESKLATGASARGDDSHDPGLFFASAQVEPENLDKARNALLDTLETLRETPFTEEEVSRAKVRSKRAAEMCALNASAMASALSTASSYGDWRLLFIQRDRIEAVTAKDVNRVAAYYFQKHNRTVGIFQPEKEPQRLAITPAPSLDSIVKDYKGGAVAVAGEQFDPSPANLDARLKTIESGNLKAGLLAKKNRGETVSLALTLHYGNEESLKGQTTAASLLPGMMMAGTKQHDRQALREELDKLGVRISPGVGGFGGRGGRRGGGGGGGAAGQLTFSVEAKKDTLPAALALLGEILREPAFPAAEFETRKRAMKAGLAAMSTEPDMLARNKLSRALSPYSMDHPRYVPSLEETQSRIEDVTLEQIKTLYETQLGASQAELAVVGDFDADEVLKQVRKMLEGWSSKVTVKRIDGLPPTDRSGSKETIQTPDKANATFLAGLSFPMNENDPDYAAMRIGNYIFGGSTLASRLGDRIRQKDGLSYGATSSFAASARDAAASFTIAAITNPENIGKVEVDAMEELTRFLKDGPTDTEVADAKKAFLDGQKVGRTSDAAIAGQILTNLNLGRTFVHSAEQEKAIQALTPAQVAEAFRKRIDPKKLVIIHAGDFKK